MKAYWLDTSLLLRFVTGEPEELAKKALLVFQKAEEGRFLLKVHPLVVAEAFYTLVSFYKAEKGQAAETLLALLDRPGVEVLEGDAVFQALQEAGKGGLSFVDAFLLFQSGEKGEGVATLDTRLRKRVGAKTIP
ncbi:PIN domain-containing protein [Thermus filiformis]|uniref:PIN domain-containing protein n=1 Tax=Thermus filiformis TaxID=276 RepID=UPI001F2EA11F|nr:PIN domain-containing protein [Thermus filiformis]